MFSFLRHLPTVQAEFPSGDASAGMSCLMPGGVTFQHGATWRDDSCTSCQCVGGETACFSQTCPPVDCDKPLLKKGQCCPTCLGETSQPTVSIHKYQGLYSWNHTKPRWYLITIDIMACIHETTKPSWYLWAINIRACIHETVLNLVDI